MLFASIAPERKLFYVFHLCSIAQMLSMAKLEFLQRAGAPLDMPTLRQKAFSWLKDSFSLCNCMAPVIKVSEAATE